MQMIFTVVTVAMIVALFVTAAGDFVRLKFVLGNMAEVGVPEPWLPRLATLKAAGAVGLLLGLLGVPIIGEAATIGLVLFFIGAVVTHIRAKVFYNIAFPGSYLLLAVATLVVVLIR